MKTEPFSGGHKTCYPSPMASTLHLISFGYPLRAAVRSLVTLFFVALCSVLFTTSSAHACSCAGREALTEALSKSTIVFMGQVISVRQNPLKPTELEVQFRISVTYKGEEEIQGQTATIITNGEESMCGYPFTRGGDYVVFATGNPANLRTGLCSRTSQLEAFQDDLPRLEELTGKKPLHPVEPKKEEPITKPGRTHSPQVDGLIGR